jgi:hypothetical protein
MTTFKKVLGIFLILMGPSLIYAGSTTAFGNAMGSQGLWDALPWLLLATVMIPLGMAIAVVGFLYLKGEYGN